MGHMCDMGPCYTEGSWRRERKQCGRFNRRGPSFDLFLSPCFFLLYRHGSVQFFISLYIHIYICIYLSIYLSIYLFINLSLLSVIIPRSLMGDLEDESTVLHWLLELLCAEPLFCVHVSSASALLPVQSVSDDVNSTSGSSASTALPIMYVLMNLGFSIYVSVWKW